LLDLVGDLGPATARLRQRVFAVCKCGYVHSCQFQHLQSSKPPEIYGMDRRTIFAASPFVGVTTTPIGLARAGRREGYKSG
jgi:hypothetical protein